MYIVAFYFVGTTITTVGYGDFSPSNSYERMFGLMLMIIGISAFGYMSGTLSSILSNYDSSAAENMERLLLLNNFRQKYDIPDELYAEVRTTIKAVDSQQELEERDRFLDGLPPIQRNELMLHFHEKEFSKFPFFHSVGDRTFTSWIAAHLRPKVYTQGQIIYTEGDEIDGFYFLTKGVVAFNLQSLSGMIFAVVDPL